MSYDVWVDSFRNDASVSISREALREIFGAFVTEVEPTVWHVCYDESNSSDIYLSLHAEDPNKIFGLSVNRPCADDRLWKSLTQVLRAAPFAFYAPDGPPVIVYDTVIAHLPQGMIETLGEPIRLSAGEIITDVW